jgi:LysM repeat protein
MTLQRRASLATLFGAGCLLLAGCGGDSGAEAREPLTPVQPTSYVTIEPETTTTTIAAAQTTVPPEGAIVPTEQIHTIQAGDSLSKIAGLYGITLDQLLQYNSITIDHFLGVGETLKIPPGAKAPGTATAASSGDTAGAGDTTSEAATPTGTEPAGEGCTHTIQAGENPSGVAEDYGITFDILQQANPDRDFREWFMVGEDINIPAGADC